MLTYQLSNYPIKDNNPHRKSDNLNFQQILALNYFKET